MNTAQQIILRLESLPGRRQTAMQVLRVLQDQNSRAAQIASAIGTDPVLAARVMQLANSAYYGMAGRVKRLDIAVALLGRTAIQAFAAAILVEESTDTSHDHAIATAVAASVLAPRLQEDPGVSFACGLVHDLGAVLLKQFDAEGYAEVSRLCVNMASDDRCHEERERWGADHAHVGAEALDHWGFPLEIVRAVAFHHSPDVLATPPLARAVRYGDRLAEALSTPPERLDYAGLVPESLARPDDIVPMLSTIRQRIAQLA